MFFCAVGQNMSKPTKYFRSLGTTLLGMIPPYEAVYFTCPYNHSGSPNLTKFGSVLVAFVFFSIASCRRCLNVWCLSGSLWLFLVGFCRMFLGCLGSRTGVCVPFQRFLHSYKCFQPGWAFPICLFSWLRNVLPWTPSQSLVFW